MTLDKDFEIRCQQVWLEAWVRTAGSDNCVKLSTPTNYADECLKMFRERFREDINKP